MDGFQVEKESDEETDEETDKEPMLENKKWALQICLN